ncbi:MAG: hypothetical protein HFF98_09765 [Oscillibacter sp.]|jgi:hypothetical protein|nr:hypothetical protein [Oscillibacter sp.]
MNGGAGMTSHAQLVRAGVALHCMDQLLFLLPHPGGSAETAFTGLLFQCVPDERRRSAGRHLLEAFPLLQGSGSEKRSCLFIIEQTPAQFHCAREVIPAPPIIQPQSPVPGRALLLFLFWTVHGPFSHFLLEEKEKMGGAKHQPSSWL